MYDFNYTKNTFKNLLLENVRWLIVNEKAMYP